MTSANTSPVVAPAEEVDLSLAEFLELTGGVPAKEAPEVVAERRRKMLERLDPNDNPF